MNTKQNEEQNNQIFFADQTLITEEYFNYLYENNIETLNLIMCEYLGLFARMNDVVKIIDFNNKNIRYVAPGDENEPYYYELEYPGNTYPWKDKRGSIKYIYDEFKNRNIKLSTATYKENKAKTKRLI